MHDGNKMERRWEACNFTFHNGVRCSYLAKGQEIPHTALRSMAGHAIMFRMPWTITLFRSILLTRTGQMSKSKEKAASSDHADLKPGDLVRVRSEEEIRETLDKNGRLRGLLLMPEMYDLCNQEFRVHKKVERLLLESTGEMRTVKSPTYSLSGAFCDGSRHNGCDRSCFFLWKREWLEKL